MKKLSKNEFENLLQNLVKQTQLILPTLEDKQLMLQQRPLLSRCISRTMSLAVLYRDMEYNANTKIFEIIIQTPDSSWFYKNPTADFVFDVDDEILYGYTKSDLDDLYNYYLNNCER